MSYHFKVYPGIFITGSMYFSLQGPPGPPGPSGPTGEKVKGSIILPVPFHLPFVLLTENVFGCCVKTISYYHKLISLFVVFQGELGLPGPAGFDGQKVCGNETQAKNVFLFFVYVFYKRRICLFSLFAFRDLKVT